MKFAIVLCLLVSLVSLSACTHYAPTQRQTAGIFAEMDPVEVLERSAEETSEFPYESPRVVTNLGLNLLKEYEGTVRCKYDQSKHCPYQDAANYCTIGYGHLVAKKPCREIRQLLKSRGFAGGISDERATDVLKIDLTIAQEGIDKHIVDTRLGRTAVTEYQYDALVSFTFNVGVGNFSQSTLLRELRLREKLPENEEVAYQFTRWVKSAGKTLPGLVNRRRREVEHFFAGFDTNFLDVDLGYESDAVVDEAEQVDVLKGEQ